MSTAGNHPLFARTFHWLSRRDEMAGQREFRREALDGLTGRVVELGAGNGLNFEHYPTTGADDAASIVDDLAELAERCGLRELVVRAHAHRARLGVSGSLESARLLAAEIDNPTLEALVAPPVPA